MCSQQCCDMYRSTALKSGLCLNVDQGTHAVIEATHWIDLKERTGDILIVKTFKIGTGQWACCAELHNVACCPVRHGACFPTPWCVLNYVIGRSVLHHRACWTTPLGVLNYAIRRAVPHHGACCPTSLGVLSHIIRRAELRPWACFPTPHDVLN